MGCLGVINNPNGNVASLAAARAAKKKRPRRVPECPHPDRKHCAKGMCKSCYMMAYMRENPTANTGNVWLKNNPEKARVIRRRNGLRSRHGDGAFEFYEQAWRSQGGRCANPGCDFRAPLDVKDFRTLGFHIDHCHKTGRRRGLLCSGCNIALGQAGENEVRLSGLIAYIRMHKDA